MLLLLLLLLFLLLGSGNHPWPFERVPPVVVCMDGDRCPPGDVDRSLSDHSNPLRQLVVFLLIPNVIHLRKGNGSDARDRCQREGERDSYIDQRWILQKYPDPVHGDGPHHSNNVANVDVRDLSTIVEVARKVLRFVGHPEAEAGRNTQKDLDGNKKGWLYIVTGPNQAVPLFELKVHRRIDDCPRHQYADIDRHHEPKGPYRLPDGDCLVSADPADLLDPPQLPKIRHIHNVVPDDESPHTEAAGNRQPLVVFVGSPSQVGTQQEISTRGHECRSQKGHAKKPWLGQGYDGVLAVIYQKDCRPEAEDRRQSGQGKGSCHKSPVGGASDDRVVVEEAMLLVFQDLPKHCRLYHFFRDWERNSFVVVPYEFFLYFFLNTLF